MLEIIPVQPSSSASGYIMVELQGELEFDSDKKNIVRQIGILARAQQGADTLQLTIGNHQLTGKLVDLKKPLLVLEKGSEPQTCYRVSHSDGIFMQHDDMARSSTKKLSLRSVLPDANKPCHLCIQN